MEIGRITGRPCKDQKSTRSCRKPCTHLKLTQYCKSTMLWSKKEKRKRKKSTGVGPNVGTPPTPRYVLNLHGHLHPGFPLLASGSLSFLSVPTTTPPTRARLRSAWPSHPNTTALQFHSGPAWPVPRAGPGWQKWASGRGRHPRTWEGREKC